MYKYNVLKTDEFEIWLNAQAPKSRLIIKSRLELIAIGHFGNHKRFDNIIELRWINGTRIYSFIW
jgi:putative component of toxin-antitoxin plasmid stabilization module